MGSLVVSDTSGAGAGSALSSDLTEGSAKSMEEDPLVSVVIPCFNGEAFLRATIESALAQSYPNVEIIVVDDGSTDHSAEIAQSFPVRYIHQPNRGLTPSRNLGIQESRGSYLVFLDADDRLMPEAIEAGLRVLVRRPECALTLGDHLFVSEDGSYLANSRKTFPPARHYEALLKSNCFEMISSILFRRSIFDQVGVFDTELRVAEDYDLYLRIARENAICCHPGVVAEYRMHQGSASHNSELMLTMTLQVLKSQRLYIRSHPGLVLAYLEGTRNWRRRYGRQLASELARSFSTLPAGDLRRKILLLAVHYPQGLLLLLLLRTMPGLSKRKRGKRREGASKRWPHLLQVHAWLVASKPQSSTQIG
jgi:glycosyltransferase involved in cell wall biosynthesis